MTYVVVIVNLDILRYSSCTLHDPDSLVIIPVIPVYKTGFTRKRKNRSALLTDLHFRPFTPHLCEVFHSLEVHFRTFLQNFPRAVEVWFCLTNGAAFFVKLGKIHVESV